MNCKFRVNGETEGAGRFTAAKEENRLHEQERICYNE